MTATGVEDLIDLLNEKGGAPISGSLYPYLNTVCRPPTLPRWPAQRRRRFPPRCCTILATCCTGSTKISPIAATMACTKS